MSTAFPWSFPSGWYRIARWWISGNFSGLCQLCNVILSRSWGPAELSATFGFTLRSRPLFGLSGRMVLCSAYSCALMWLAFGACALFVFIVPDSAKRFLRVCAPRSSTYCWGGSCFFKLADNGCLLRVCGGHLSWSSKLGAHGGAFMLGPLCHHGLTVEVFL